MSEPTKIDPKLEELLDTFAAADSVLSIAYSYENESRRKRAALKIAAHLAAEIQRVYEECTKALRNLGPRPYETSEHAWAQVKLISEFQDWVAAQEAARG